MYHKICSRIILYRNLNKHDTVEGKNYMLPVNHPGKMPSTMVATASR